MRLLDLIDRTLPAAPWAEGEKIPWDEPGFSRRMLAEHLSQDHDAASRRSETIDRHVRWIHNELLGGAATRVLDLACGPGLYASRLARLGHECVGIDFSPASIAHAADAAERDRLACTYRREDIRAADFETGFGLAMLIFGEFNVFRPREARRILAKAQAALAPGGRLLLEPHTYDAAERLGRAAPSWQARRCGLFSDRPHLLVEESFWDVRARAATTRYFVIDAATGEVTRHAATTQAYRDEDYRAMLADAGFRDIGFHPSLTGGPEVHPGLLVITARNPAP